MDHFKETNLQTLPELPFKVWSPACIAFDKEILICGGWDKRDCYSYHIEKQQYQYINSYPTSVAIKSHVVIPIKNYPDYKGNNNNNNNNNNSSNIHLLSFGGYDDSYGGAESNLPYHTLIMTYKSVWDTITTTTNKNEYENENENEKEKEKKKEKLQNDNIYNQWISPSNNIILGEITKHNWYGARAAIGGLHEHLLFISHPPHNIEVINLIDFKCINEVKDKILPVSGKNYTKYHCFELINKKNTIHEFFFMSEGEMLLIVYNEDHKIFSYQNLSLGEPLKGCFNYGYSYVNHRIFIFGGWNDISRARMNDIWVFNLQQKTWNNLKTCNFAMPYTTSGVTAIFHPYDSCIHLIGGRNARYEYQNTHYIKNEYVLSKINKILNYLIRNNSMIKIGWIKEFDNIILQYLLE